MGHALDHARPATRAPARNYKKEEDLWENEQIVDGIFVAWTAVLGSLDLRRTIGMRYLVSQLPLQANVDQRPALLGPRNRRKQILIICVLQGQILLSDLDLDNVTDASKGETRLAYAAAIDGNTEGPLGSHLDPNPSFFVPTP